MLKPRQKSLLPTVEGATIRRKATPYKFVLDAIVFLLRERPKEAQDNGIWLATTKEHHESLRREFPNMRSIQLLGKDVTGWQVLPSQAPDFEESALRACELVVKRDTRIGKVPKSKQSAKPRR